MTGPDRELDAVVEQRLAALGSRRTRPPKRHPARAARAGAFATSLAATGGLVVVLAHVDAVAVPLAGAAAITPPPVSTSQAPRAASAAVPASPAPTPGRSAPTTTAPTATAAPSPARTFDGALVSTRYGDVQVRAEVTGGRLVQVVVEASPGGRSRSVAISRRALPQLEAESVAAQRADVDAISGATYTSDGYVRSLQAALDAARAAGVLRT
jgi:uncharacterized protein with FMN-binding domain